MAKSRGRSRQGGGGRSRQGGAARQGSGSNRSSRSGGRDDEGLQGSTGEGRRHKGPGGERVEGRQAVRELLIAGSRRVHEIVMQVELDQADILEDIVLLAQDRRVPIRAVSYTHLTLPTKA